VGKAKRKGAVRDAIREEESWSGKKARQMLAERTDAVLAYQRLPFQILPEAFIAMGHEPPLHDTPGMNYTGNVQEQSQCEIHESRPAPLFAAPDSQRGTS
jgi:hypothetical protein